MKKIISIILFLCFIVSLCGCSQQTNDTSSTAPVTPNSSHESTTQEPSNTPLRDDSKTITTEYDEFVIQIIENTPTCNTIVSTGQKAAETIAKITNTKIPKIGEYITYKTISNRTIYIYRMPSTSRAYPLSLQKKSVYYRQLLNECNIL